MARTAAVSPGGARAGRPPRSQHSARARRLDRRQALVALLGIPLAVTGCTSGDRLSGNSPASRSPGSTPTGRSALPTGSTSPSPLDPRTGQAATREQALADRAGAILHGRARTQLNGAQRAALSAIRNAHLAHVAALRSPEPTSRPTPTAAATQRSNPSLERLSLAAALPALIKAERAAATAARRAALGAHGFDALLYGSLSIAASRYAAALASKDPVPFAKPIPPRGLPALSDVQAVQDVVAQLHALIYGYQLAIGKLPVLSKRHQRAVAELLQQRILRDRLIAILTRRGAAVPAAEPAYVPAVRVHDPASAARSIRLMRSALLPYCGLFLAAAASPADRSFAFDTLNDAAEIAGAWGAALTTWPGWPA
jgi:hypothetical protein